MSTTAQEVPNELHPSHVTRVGDASSWDEICIHCGRTDQVPGGWGELAKPCPNPNGEKIPEDAGKWDVEPRTSRTQMQQIDYGPAPSEIVAILEEMRKTLSPEKRLLMAKLLGRTVAADGDDAERKAGALIDLAVTEFFRGKDLE